MSGFTLLVLAGRLACSKPVLCLQRCSGPFSTADRSGHSSCYEAGLCTLTATNAPQIFCVGGRGGGTHAAHELWPGAV